jgi:hypothetical protein
MPKAHQHLVQYEAHIRQGIRCRSSMVTFINFKLICYKYEVATMNQMSESDRAIKGCSLLAKVAEVM